MAVNDPANPTPSNPSPTTTHENMVPQARLNEMAAEKNKYKEELDALKAAAAAKETEEAKTKGEYQKLAEKHEKELAELKPTHKATVAERDMLKKLIDDQLSTEVEALPAELKSLIPDDADYATKAAFLKKMKPLVDKLSPNNPDANVAKTPDNDGTTKLLESIGVKITPTNPPAATTTPGSAPRPKPTDKQRMPASDAVAAAVEAMKSSGKYAI
jgi:hypothetical protein